MNDPFSLDRLNDLARPESVSWWPLAIGWWFVIALAVIWLLAAAALAFLRWRRNAYRREGLRCLASTIETAGSPEDRVLAVSVVLKRVALAAFPRPVVASLTGDEWKSFLARTCPAAGFEQQPAALIAVAMNGDARIDDEAARKVQSAAEIWIQQHRREAN